jgi:hypothetical protein
MPMQNLSAAPRGATLRAIRNVTAVIAGCLLLGTVAAAQVPANSETRINDPRVGLRAGWGNDAESARRNLELVATRPRARILWNPENPGEEAFKNTDLAFAGNLLFQGNYSGWTVWDVSNPVQPELRTALLCPGGQGDVSVFQNLLFMSAEETRGRIDCGTQGAPDTVSTERFRGVRIFDIRNIDQPKQVGAVQTCRGSHTHTLVADPRDAAHVYVYVSGTARPRLADELAGCYPLQEDTTTSYFRIEVIRVPLARPQDARIVNRPFLFADSAGNIAGLWRGGNHGEGTQTTRPTVQCHDITAYVAIGLAAGACAGNGILLDIRDPANPRRVAEVIDPNFNYFHSATFSNDGRTVVFTDEWGGGRNPRCRATDRIEWGGDAIFTIENGRMKHAGYFKMPAPQTEMENCVAHNGSLVPVPGRDIMAQGWYQGGLSVFDFSDPAHPVEIAYFDRGPVDSTKLYSGGYWSTYWYNGYIYGSEIARGLDVFNLIPSEYLSRNEIDAAKLVRYERFNVQDQQRYTWPARFVVARAYLDQLVRNDGLRATWARPIYQELVRAEKARGVARRTALTRLATQLDRDIASSSDPERVRALAAVVRELAK